MKHYEMLSEKKFVINASSTSGFAGKVIKTVFCSIITIGIALSTEPLFIGIIVPVAIFYLFHGSKDYIILNHEGVRAKTYWNGTQFLRWENIKLIDCYTNYESSNGIDRYPETNSDYKDTTSKIYRKVICISINNRPQLQTVNRLLAMSKQIVIPHTGEIYTALQDYWENWKINANYK